MSRFLFFMGRIVVSTEEIRPYERCILYALEDGAKTMDEISEFLQSAGWESSEVGSSRLDSGIDNVIELMRW